MPSPIKYDRPQRFRWYLQVEKYHRPVKEVCQVFGISRKCYYKWRARDFGQRANTYLSAKQQPNLKLTWPVRKFIEEQKFVTNYGPLKMKLLVKRKLGLDLSTTIIYRYYQRRKLIRKPQKRLPWYRPMKERIIISQPGQGVQLDVKYVYQEGARKYQFSVFDPFTSMYYFEVFATKESKNAVLALERAETYFGFKVTSVQTDNGSEFRGYFHDWLTRRNIPHYFIPKASPYWNAQVERVHKTIDDEYYQNPYRIMENTSRLAYLLQFRKNTFNLKGANPAGEVTQKCYP